MKNYTIFAVDEINDESIYAVVYEASFDIFEHSEIESKTKGEPKNEFRRLFDNWGDVEYLQNFFESNIADLNRDFYNYLSIDEAIQITLDEAELLEDELIDIAEKGKTNNEENLQSLFQPLHENEKSLFPIPELQENKLYGSGKKSWLRIYAIRINKNLFFITGGAIKLTKTMNKREHLLNEMEKLNVVKAFLIEQQIIDADSLIEFMEL